MTETVFVALAELSKSALVLAIAAFGACASLEEFVKIGPGPFLVLGLQMADFRRGTGDFRKYRQVGLIARTDQP